MGKIVEARPAAQSSGVERKTPLPAGAAGTTAPVIAPMVDQLAAELAGRARVAKLNIDGPGPMIAPRRPDTGFGLSDT
jgi:hypothetical protein